MRNQDKNMKKQNNTIQGKRREQDGFDEMIRQTLRAGTANMELDENIKQNIGAAIRDNEEDLRGQKENTVWRWSARKTIVVAVVFSLFTSIVCFGAVQLSYWGESHFGDKLEDEEMEQLEEKLGYGILWVSSFTNGYACNEAQIMNAYHVYDEEHKTFKGSKVDINYRKEGFPIVYFSAERYQYVGTEFKNEYYMETYNGVSLYYSQDYYLLVPGDYEPTEEEWEAVTEGRLYISAGAADIPTLELFSSVSFEKDDIGYWLMSRDTPLSREEMLQMAREILDSADPE